MSGLPAFEAVKDAIVSGGSLDTLVTYALRRVGFGNDSWSLSYPDITDPDTRHIPAGCVELCCVGFSEPESVLVAESQYLSVLIEKCREQGLEERAELLSDFSVDPSCVEHLIEVDESRCLERWRKALPYLLECGWSMSDGMIVSPLGGRKISSEYYTDDLNVLFRETKKALNTQPDHLWREDCETLLDALGRYFRQEADADISSGNNVE